MSEADRMHIGTVEKNHASEVRVALSDFGGRTFVDVRVYMDRDQPQAHGWADRRATRRGVTLHVRRIDALVSLLLQARAEVEARGLLDEDRP